MTTQELKFDEQGLIPAVVQDHYTKKVLTLAYMNAESLDISMRGKAHLLLVPLAGRRFGARGRLAATCSALCPSRRTATATRWWWKSIKAGPACHLGTDSCFADRALRKRRARAVFYWRRCTRLHRGPQRTERPRAATPPTCLKRGVDKILKKVGEECTEVIIAGPEGRPGGDHLRNRRSGVPCAGPDGRGAASPWKT